MSDGTLALVAGEAIQPRERRQDLRRVLRELARNKAALIGLLILLGVVVAAVCAPLVSPHDPLAQAITHRLKPLAWSDPTGQTYLLGTDHLGRDILSRLIFGARISLIIGLSAVTVAGTIGTLIGLVAGYRGGRVDDFCMRLTDTMLAMPFILLALAVIAVLGPSLRNIIFVLGITSWVSYARVVRAEVLSLRTREFVAAAQALGGGGRRIVFRHLLPNVLTPVIVIATLEVARMIILESALSFLGLGVQPPTPTWGGMLADGRAYLSTAWWLATFPGLSIMLTVLGINLLGDWLRDVLDPRLQL
ncbi:MAG TPA: ABC transporter permease [Candidatus Methylomirabilis sp.]|nr:ABC transporter permease [Candidatus Methylomirabilis sp.]